MNAPDKRPDRSDAHARKCRELAQILIPAIRHRAKQLGYAVGVHGSLAYDIDLIACPWREGALPARDLADAVQAIALAVCGHAFCPDRDGAANPEYFADGSPGAKPHGRLCWSFHLGAGPYIDLSVMPRQVEPDQVSELSVCDQCRDPGACCRHLFLYNSAGAMTAWTPLDALLIAAVNWLPFVLHGDRHDYVTDDGEAYATFAYACPELDSNGRCSIYETRPELCRAFEPKSSPLCVEYVAAEQVAA